MKQEIDAMLAIGQVLREKDNFLITSHYSPDGDNIGSSYALWHFLQTLGKKALIINEDPIPEKYLFILETECFKTFAEYDGAKFENVIILDAGSFERIGKVATLIADEHTIINIDHHYSNVGFGTHNLILPDRAATAQIIFELFKANGLSFDASAASAMYLGLLTDTGGFRYQNTDSRVLNTAAELVSCGIKPDEIMEQAFHVHHYRDIVKLGKLLAGMELILPYGVALVYQHDMVEPIEDNDLVVEMLNSVAEAKIMIFVRRVEEKLLKISFRSRCEYNVSAFAARYGGGGHPQAAGLRFRSTFEQFRQDVLEVLFAELV